ncbi:lipopolysaccharide biosynthesis protein [Hymenobacter sp. HDW8]|uniref:lipopolysaccharide biosynthesis protein n=1 Tax=Hymenobacter sp. HDW8 TaxID=2714932 RepID=UPI00140C599F|nr:polysaccharide biosynthesis protein [Hymenobacter sp. HDW8]QIL75340.1 polysaccharide biosynthesis protein [Hymenobacter sp. HDW8]
MKVLTQRLAAHPHYTKALEWGKLVTITGGTQTLVQAVSLLCGILVIRLLPTQEYALYTLANTMLGTMILLADGGITAGVMAQGGKVWQDKQKLGTVLRTGLQLRKQFALGCLLLGSPVLWFLLRHHGASWLMSALIIGSLIPAFLTALSSQLLEITPKLHQAIAPLQKIQVEVSIGRLVFLGLTIFFFPMAFVATLAAGLPQIWGNRRLAHLADNFTAPSPSGTDPVVRKEILAFVKRLLPGVMYYCASSQITLWLISIFGTTAAVAEVGALGRLAIITSVFRGLLATLVSPRFARMPPKPALLLNRYLKIQLGLLLLSVAIIGAAGLFAKEILWVLGPQYAHLQNEVLLSAIGSCLALVAGSSFTLYIHRGWAINPVISITLEITAVILGVLLIDISTLKGVLLLNIFIASVQALMHVSFSLLKITGTK